MKSISGNAFPFACIISAVGVRQMVSLNVKLILVWFKGYFSLFNILF